jgi:hypothetical protein
MGNSKSSAKASKSGHKSPTTKAAFKAAIKGLKAKLGPAKKTGPVPPTKPAAAPVAAKPQGKANGHAPVPTKVTPPVRPTPTVSAAAPKPVGSKKGGTKPMKTTLSPMFGNRGSSVPVANTLAGANDEVCREVACEGLATTGGYCRMHYIKNWKKIKVKEVILKEGKLTHYIAELVAKYPEKYIDAIRDDLSSEKEFAKVIHDLDLDESVDDFEGDGESMDGVIDSIKREFEDEGEGGF